MPPPSAPTIREVAAGIARHPGERLIEQWNWKSALLSSVIRAFVLLAANASDGWPAAWSAALVELAFRAAVSGVYGTLTEAFSRARPAWAAFATAMIVMPVSGHALQFAVHYLHGTPALLRSMVLSVAVTLVSTAFNFFAMRRGMLTVGDGHQPLSDDLRQLPRVIVDFVLWPLR